MYNVCRKELFMRKLRKNITIDEAIWKKLQELAKKENRSASNFIEYLIEKYKPDHFAIEELFFNSNQKTAINVAQARGVLLVAAANKNVPISEYTPLQVKQSVTGYGRAEKKQIQQMVKMLLGLNAIPKPDDAADALAIAICHAHSSKMNKMFDLNGVK